MFLTMNTVIKYFKKPNAQKVCLKFGTSIRSSLHAITGTLGLVRQGRRNSTTFTSK